MVNTLKLKGLIAENGMTQAGLAKEMKMSKSTFYRKIKKKCFNTDEMNKIVSILNVKDPLGLFFCD